MRVPFCVFLRSASSRWSKPGGMVCANSNQKSNMSPRRYISDSSAVAISSHSMKWAIFASLSSNRREPRCASAMK